MDRTGQKSEDYMDDTFDEIISGIKNIYVPDIEIDKKRIMLELTKNRRKHSVFGYLTPVLWSYLIVSTFYFFYFFRGIISNMILYYTGNRLRQLSHLILALIKIVSNIPNIFLIMIVSIPFLCLLVMFVFKLVVLHRNIRRRKYEKIS